MQIYKSLAFLLAFYAIPGKTAKMSQCAGLDLEMAEEEMYHINQCLEIAGVKKVMDIPASKIPCFAKCAFEKYGLIDDKGMPHKEKIMSLITDNLPKEVHDDLIKKVDVCFGPKKLEKINPNDPSCATYLPFFMCIHTSFMEECGDDDE